MSTSYPVRELLTLVRRAVEVCFPEDVWVEGEISGIRRTRTGHVYFQLVEPVTTAGATPTAALDVVLFDDARREVNARLDAAGGAIRMVDGVRIRIGGRLEVYSRNGHVQLKMRDIDPAFTLAQLTLARDEVVRRLADAGLLDRNATLPVPPMPLRLGLVTSLGSAAHADLLHELEGSGLAWRVVQCDASVQGAGAEQALVRALRRVVRAGAEVVAVVRGGGARTDLAAFDSEVLARAIATCPVPVFTGIGHEIDRSVADEVAAVACKTPTACAAELVARARVGITAMEECWDEVRRKARDACQEASQRLDANAHLTARRTIHHVTRAEERLHTRTDSARRVTDRALRGAARGLDERTAALGRGAPDALRRAEHELTTHTHRVDGHDPARVLARGWSLTRTTDGRVVRRTTDVAPDEVLHTTVADGELTSTLLAATPTPPPRHA